MWSTLSTFIPHRPCHEDATRAWIRMKLEKKNLWHAFKSFVVRTTFTFSAGSAVSKSRQKLYNDNICICTKQASCDTFGWYFTNGNHWPWLSRSCWSFWLRIIANAAFPCNNSSQIRAGITKFVPSMNNRILWSGVEYVSHWPWPSSIL